MRILYITSMLPFGAGEAFFIPEVKELKRRGHDVLVVPMRPRGTVVHADAQSIAAYAVNAPILSMRIVLAACCEAIRRPARSLSALWALRRSRNVRILLKNVAVFPKGLWLARLARQTGADHVYAQWISTSATMAWVASRVSGVPWSVTAHRWDIAEGNLVEEKVRSAIFVRAIDQRGREGLAAGVEPKLRDKIVVVHMGVPRALTESRPLAVVPDVLRVLIAANLVEVKGHVYALEAVRLACHLGVRIRLDIAGAGPLSGVLRERAAELGIQEQVRWLGVLSHSELIEKLKCGCWDVALLPSVTTSSGEQEGIPVFLIEALASGVPVVATSTGGIPELLGGGGGVMVPQRDGPALAEALVLVARDHEFRARLSRDGVRRVLASFLVEGAVDQIEAMIRVERSNGPIEQRERLV